MNSKRIMDIELLRGIAVLGVLFHHIRGNLFLWTDPAQEEIATHVQFWWGVDLFFAISGFVIARGLIPVLQGCTSGRQFWQQTRNFWIRRAFRLLPAAWLWLVLILLASVFLNRSGAFGGLQTNLQATLAGFLQFANFRFADSFFHYPYGASFVYWSLSLEEQFYLLFPLFILVCRQRLVWALMILVAVQIFTERSMFLMIIRTDALALGVLLAIWSTRPSFVRWEPKLLSHSWAGVLLFVIVGLVLGMLAAGRFSLPSYRVGAIALLCAGLVWIASYNRDYLLPRGPLKNLLTWVGSRSYGMYLIHIPVYFVLRELCFRLQSAGLPSPADHPALSLVLAMTLIVVLSELNYRFIELPMRNRGTRLVERLDASRTTVPSSGATSSC